MKSFVSECRSPSAPTPLESRVACRFEQTDVTVGEAIRAALFRGELAARWQTVLRRLAVEYSAAARGLSADLEAVQTCSEAFRYEHDLISAEEAETWLGARDVSLEQFTRYFLQQYWLEAGADELGEMVLDLSLDPTEATADQWEWLRVCLMLTGEMGMAARQCAWRLAASGAGREPTGEEIGLQWERFRARAGVRPGREAGWAARLGETGEWLSEQIRLEACFESICDSVLTDPALERAIAGHGRDWMRFQVETMDLRSREAAEEARLCLEHDGISMDELARRCGVPGESMTVYLEELPDDLREMLLRTGVGGCMDPIEVDGGYQLNRVVEKIDPTIADASIRERARCWVLRRHFEGLCGHRIHWSIDEGAGG